MVKYVEFLFSLILRFISGAFFASCIGICYYWLPFLMGSASGRLPWYLLRYWALVGGIIMVLIVPRYQYPWRKPKRDDE